MSVPTKQCPQCGASMLQDDQVCSVCQWEDPEIGHEGYPLDDESEDDEDE